MVNKGIIELEGEQQWDIQIQVSYDWNQSTLGSSSTIIHPLTEVEGRKITQAVNKPNLLSLDHNLSR